MREKKKRLGLISSHKRSPGDNVVIFFKSFVVFLLILKTKRANKGKFVKWNITLFYNWLQSLLITIKWFISTRAKK